MNVIDYLRILRKRWKLVAASVAVAVVAAVAAIFTATPSYSATAALYVSTPTNDITGAYQGQQLDISLVNSYIHVVSSPQVLGPVIARLKLPVTVLQLQKRVKASSPQNTSLINIVANSRHPGAAAATANEVAAQLGRVIEQLEAPLGGGSSPVKATVVQPATAPTSPATPRKALDLALGLLVGLVIGVGGAILRDTLDRSVQTPDELRDLADAPVLGVIGYDPDVSVDRLIVVGKPNAPVSEGFRQLRTNLQFLSIDDGLRSIVVTSPLPNEGKTTTACNLAITLSEAGVRCLLIEADLRRPKVSEYMGLDSTVGLTSILTGKVSWADAVQPWGAGELRVLPSGPLPPNPSELLGSEQMRKLLSELHHEFEIVVLDASPLLPVTDGAVIATRATGALLVTRSGETSRDQLRSAVGALRTVDVPVLGTVLNMVPSKGTDGYHYTYLYKHSYSHLRPLEGSPDALAASRLRGPEERGVLASEASGPPSRYRRSGPAKPITLNRRS